MSKLDLKVIYAEDAEIIRKKGVEIIQETVQTVYEAADGVEGLNKFKEYMPDILITDIGMPNMDGLTLAREVKKIKPNTKIIITTAHDDSKYLIDSIEIGIDYYLLKSSFKSQLVPSIQKCYELILAERRSRAETDFMINISKSLIEESPLIIVVTNINGDIEFANKNFVDWTGYGFEEIIGRNPRFLSAGKRPKEFYQELWTTISSGKKWRGTFINKKKNGEEYIEKAIIYPLKNQFGEINYYVKFSISRIALGEFDESVESLPTESSTKKESISSSFMGLEVDPLIEEQFRLALKSFCQKYNLSNEIVTLKINKEK